MCFLASSSACSTSDYLEYVAAVGATTLPVTKDGDLVSMTALNLHLISSSITLGFAAARRACKSTEAQSEPICAELKLLPLH